MAGVPVVAFRLNDKYKEENPSVQQQWIATMLRTKGWIIPNYNVSSPWSTLAKHRLLILTCSDRHPKAQRMWRSCGSSVSRFSSV
jgi:hypothetical protein